jgi:hypothetical protein
MLSRDGKTVVLESEEDEDDEIGSEPYYRVATCVVFSLKSTPALGLGLGLGLTKRYNFL